MADWTNIPDATFDPDRPVLGSTHLAIVKNFEALAEGAANAPRVLTPAINDAAVTTAKIADGNVTNQKLVAPTAGSNVIFRLQPATVRVQNFGYADVNLNNRAITAGHLGCTVLIAGTITCALSHRNVTASTSAVRILKNGAQVIEWTQSGGAFVERSVNVSVDVGDAIIFQAHSVNGGDTDWANLRILSGTITAAVA